MVPESTLGRAHSLSLHHKLASSAHIERRMCVDDRRCVAVSVQKLCVTQRRHKASRVRVALASHACLTRTGQWTCRGVAAKRQIHVHTIQIKANPGHKQLPMHMVGLVGLVAAGSTYIQLQQLTARLARRHRKVRLWRGCKASRQV